MSEYGPPEDVLDRMLAARQRARLARRASWLPLLTFGLIVAAATPFYVGGPPAAGSSRPGPLALMMAPAHAPSVGVTLYWIIAPLLGYAVVAAITIARARHRGVRARILPYCLAGVALVAVTMVTSPLGPLSSVSVPADLWIRGLDPLLGIALGLGVLAWLDRSPGLAAFSVLFVAVALVANLYDVTNVVAGFSAPTWEIVPNLWLAALVLLLGGAAFLVVERFGPRSIRVVVERPSESAP